MFTRVALIVLSYFVLVFSCGFVVSTCQVTG